MGTITFDQIRGPIERVVLIGLSYAAGRKWISESEIVGYATLILGVAAAFYGWWQNRPQAIAQSAAALPGTTIITTPAIAAATPETNIVSNATTEAVSK